MSSHQEDDDSMEVAMRPEPSRQRLRRAAAKKAVTKQSPKKKVINMKPRVRKSKWNAKNILVDEKSPLATADLRAVLSNPMAWEALDEEDREEILALFPDDQHILSAGIQDARPDFVSLMNDDSFRHDCAAYVENIRQGRHDPEWLASAWAAHERRKIGDFDEFLENKFREEWEIDLPPEFKPVRARVALNEIEVKVSDEGEGRPHQDAAESQQDVEASQQGSNEVRVGSEDAQMDEDDTQNGDDKSPMGNGMDELQAAPDVEHEEKTIHVKQTTKMDIDSEDELA
ncbi:Fc.00g049220.m01.CDS01 [Cosmosporella sp. VM-42]